MQNSFRNWFQVLWVLKRKSFHVYCSFTSVTYHVTLAVGNPSIHVACRHNICVARDPWLLSLLKSGYAILITGLLGCYFKIQYWSWLFSDVLAPKGAIFCFSQKRAVLSVQMPSLLAELPKAQPSVSVWCTLCTSQPSFFPAKTVLSRWAAHPWSRVFQWYEESA